MIRVLVLYYSSYGHIEEMAAAVAEGAGSVGDDIEVHVRRVPETAPAGVVEASHFKTEQAYPVLEDVWDLAGYDAIILGAPTRFGRLPSQMAAFLDTAGPLWLRGALNGKVGSVFTSTGSQHGGQETTLFSLITNLMHLGLIIVGLDYGFRGQTGVETVKGGSPYGATTVADIDGSRRPGADDLDGARYQGRRVAEVTARLAKA